MYLGKPSDHTIAGGQLGRGEPAGINAASHGHSCYDNFLERKGEGLHLIKEKVGDCQLAVVEYAKKGISVIKAVSLARISSTISIPNQSSAL